MENGSVSVNSAGGDGPADIRPDDTPHNTCRPPNGEDGATEDFDRSRLINAQETQTAVATGSLNSYVLDQSENQAPRAIKIVVVMTPLNRVDDLAGMCSLLGLDYTMVPSFSGTFAVKQFVFIHSDWGMAELLGDPDSEPVEIAGLVAQLSRLS